MLVEFDGKKGVFWSKGVLGGLRRLNEEDDLVFEFPELEGAILLTGMELQAGAIAGAGHGTEALKALTAYANHQKEVIVLNAAASGALPQAELVKWYRRNGFTGGEFGTPMIRIP